MADENFKISIKGPGLVFDQSIDKAAANAIMSFVLTGGALSNGSGGEAKNGATADIRAGIGRPNTGDGGRQTIKQFIAAKRPDTQYERVACLGYYLTHVESTPEFKTLAITKANTAAAQPRLSNPSQIVSDATKTYGYLSAAGKGAKQISVLGEAVVDALPDREAVKAAIASNRPRRKTKRSAKKS
ncbi:hypothetical protein IVB18_04965 [Bradyrhizobium sp. 186]|uniref:hypothetical protein n=1 Tax=Bradyrhizobium sp. 186 TaxID=2782654 RepID=UPI00200134E0|nr:hypothetical protein [Bradyrhizobium sp. 186]UPK36709.1 hypothetical protein IVB18_04965 [Bradyrhizobium sp. 186]